MIGREGLVTLIERIDIEQPGIYDIVNMETGMRYVGSSMDLRKRFKNYNASNYSNKALEKAIKELGWGKFGIRVLEVFKSIDRKTLELHEKKYISQVGKESELYNMFGDISKQKVLRSRDRRGKSSMFVKVDEEGKLYLPLKTRRILSKIQKEGKTKSKGTRFKLGGDNPNSKRVEVLNLDTRERKVVWMKEVTSITGGSYAGVRNSIKNKTIYKGKYKLSKV